MRIAVIGAGVSGLTCAHLLHRDHDIVVYEAADYAGGHAHTVLAETPSGVQAVDTGFIVFNDRNYPGFERLLAELDVATKPSEMSFGVSDGQGFEYNGASLNGLFATRGNLARPSFHRMIADLVRFNRDAQKLLRSDANPSLGEWLSERGYSQVFTERLLVPQFAAVWSADPRGRWTVPARFLLEFFDNHGMLGFRDRPRWRTVSGGSRRYVEALVRPWRTRLRLGTPVTHVRRDGAGAVVATRDSVEHFERVILATHSDQALALLVDASESERQVLGAIGYQANEAVLHTDISMLPRRRRAWASWNYHLREELEGPPTVTYHMNRLQALDPGVELCVTLNRTAEIDPERIIGSYDYAHPIFSEAALSAQARHGEISGQRHTHYCGAYWGWGFHEDGVQSALRVAEEIGAAGLQEKAA